MDEENKKEFICGVVEGFYGKPWTHIQRKDLFKRLKQLKLNSFMYAPKDDTKHRAKWRQLYNDFEAKELKTLIEDAEANGIDFYYSLAPGLDIVYSNQEDTSLLCRKFDQLRELGCKSFAILFDDIEPTISDEKDKMVFQNNYAAAQVSVTNLIFNHLNKPKFLFCPTEYCESRAVPNVQESAYLNTIGAGLHKDIDIMWSGSRVVSRFITEDSILSLTDTIRRPPVIWENLHANDYDKKRVYLGPYSGRSTKIIPKLRGVLTNPNCEYEANYIAIHTLAQWSKCTKDINQHNTCNQDRQIVPSEQPNDSVYDPDRALIRAIQDWLPHVLSVKNLPQDANLDSLLKQRDDASASVQLAKEEHEVVEMREENSPSESKSEMDTSNSPAPIDTNSCDSYEMQDAGDVTITNENQSKSQECVDCIMCSSSIGIKHENTQICDQREQLDIDCLALLVDFFFLPFEHGSRGYALLKDTRWLIDNSYSLLETGDRHNDANESNLSTQKESSSLTYLNGELWIERATKFEDLCSSISRIINTLLHDCPNKLLAVEIYPYLVELRNVIVMINDYIRFLRDQKPDPENSKTNNTRPKEPPNIVDEQEPWVHRGGIIGDLQRLMAL